MKTALGASAACPGWQRAHARPGHVSSFRCSRPPSEGPSGSWGPTCTGPSGEILVRGEVIAGDLLNFGFGGARLYALLLALLAIAHGLLLLLRPGLRNQVQGGVLGYIGLGLLAVPVAWMFVLHHVQQHPGERRRSRSLGDHGRRRDRMAERQEPTRRAGRAGGRPSGHAGRPPSTWGCCWSRRWRPSSCSCTGSRSTTRAPSSAFSWPRSPSAWPCRGSGVAGLAGPMHRARVASIVN